MEESWISRMRSQMKNSGANGNGEQSEQPDEFNDGYPPEEEDYGSGRLPRVYSEQPEETSDRLIKQLIEMQKAILK